MIGDMFIQEERGLPLAMVGFPPLIGPVAGPVIGGYLTQNEGWRWAFWLSAITGGICELGVLAFFRETYVQTNDLTKEGSCIAGKDWRPKLTLQI